MNDSETRTERAAEICRAAGLRALDHFGNLGTLKVDRKGHQDWVSEADRDVEHFIRARLAETWPRDGIVGEEHAPVVGQSGFRWVIDPIDGTTNFVNGIPAWTVVLAGVADGRTEIGVIYDACSDEMFVARRGNGALLNGTPLRLAETARIGEGTVAVGYSNRVEALNVVPVIRALVERGAMFHRNASGALSLAYVAAGRLMGYMEEHMNAWDCLAGQLLIAEAGGGVEDQDADAMIADGGRVVAGAPGVFVDLCAIADESWPNTSG